MKYKDELVKIEIGFTSLIGVWGDRPVPWGNYFSFVDGPYIVNMWVENLEHAKDKFLTDGLVKIRNYGDIGIIIDDRIPKDYFYNKCCFRRSCSLEIAENIYEYLGDPTNELLQFTDPKGYHESRGFKYSTTHDGIVYVSKTKKLNCELKTDVSVAESSTIIYANYVPVLKTT